MALIRCADASVRSGHIGMPLRGAWLAELALDRDTAPTGAVTIESEGGFSLHGTMLRGGVQNDTAYIIVIGGAGGLATKVSGSYRSAQLRDPLDAICRGAGETLSPDVSASLLSLSLAFWTLGECTAGRGLEDLVTHARGVTGNEHSWRILADGTLWMGTESWPTSELPKTDTIENVYPSEKRSVIAPETLTLLPGVDLAGVGKVRAVDHFISARSVRSHAWV